MTQALASNDIELKSIAKELRGYSPRTIINIISNAKEIAFDNERELKSSDFIETLKSVDYKKINEREYLPEKRRRMGF